MHETSGIFLKSFFVVFPIGLALFFFGKSKEDIFSGYMLFGFCFVLIAGVWMIEQHWQKDFETILEIEDPDEDQDLKPIIEK